VKRLASPVPSHPCCNKRDHCMRERVSQPAYTNHFGAADSFSVHFTGEHGGGLRCAVRFHCAEARSLFLNQEFRSFLPRRTKSETRKAVEGRGFRWLLVFGGRGSSACLAFPCGRAPFLDFRALVSFFLLVSSSTFQSAKVEELA